MPIFPSRRKGLGAKIEGKAQSTTYALERLSLPSVPSGVTEFSLERFIPVVRGVQLILDQGATSSCVAHAFVQGIHIAEERAGLSFMPCSRLFAYYNARKEQGEKYVTDDGTYLRTCAAGLRHLGLPDEQFWPFSEFTLKVNKRPAFTAYRQAQPRSGGQYVKIYQDGIPRLDAVCSALYAGHTVAFGTLVPESFLDMDGDPNIVADPNSRLAGGHAMAIIGWKTVNGVRWFRVVNSWGLRWRDHGKCWFHESLIANQMADDFHVVLGWNRLLQAKVS